MDPTRRIAEDLQRIGLNEGDTVIIRAALGTVLSSQEKSALTPQTRKGFFLDALRQVLGPEGTVCALTFTDQFFFPAVPKSYVYDQTTTPWVQTLRRS